MYAVTYIPAVIVQQPNNLLCLMHLPNIELCIIICNMGDEGLSERERRL